MPDDSLAGGVEVEDRMAGNLGEIGAFVDDARVGNIGAFETNLLGDGVADKGTEVAGMFALDAFVAFLFHQFVDTVGAALTRTGETATTHDDGNLVGADAMTFDHFKNGTFAVVELVGHFGKFLYFLDGV